MRSERLNAPTQLEATMAQDKMDQGNGRDMPNGGIGGDDLKRRSIEADLGYGATAQDISAGCLTVPDSDSDSRIGVMPMGPMGPLDTGTDSLVLTEKLHGFLPRLPIAADR
jgi:hypothetical protein